MLTKLSSGTNTTIQFFFNFAPLAIVDIYSLQILLLLHILKLGVANLITPRIPFISISLNREILCINTVDTNRKYILCQVTII
jgi:hypothetical protein